MAATLPFWREKSLDEMNRAEWESLCDGCGRCCLLKLEDEDTGQVHATDVSCRLLDGRNCRCRDYANRREEVPDCIALTPDLARDIRWLPPTCAYRLVGQGEDLPWWHPLVSGTRDTVVEAGVSVQGRVACHEDDIPLAALPGRIVRWPMRWPAKARPRKRRGRPPAARLPE